MRWCSRRWVWTNSHLHEFEIDGQRYGLTGSDWHDRGAPDEAKGKLLRLVERVTRRLRVRLRRQLGPPAHLEKIISPEPGVRYPRCGVRAVAPAHRRMWAADGATTSSGLCWPTRRILSMRSASSGRAARSTRTASTSRSRSSPGVAGLAPLTPSRRTRAGRQTSRRHRDAVGAGRGGGGRSGRRPATTARRRWSRSGRSAAPGGGSRAARTLCARRPTEPARVGWSPRSLGGRSAPRSRAGQVAAASWIVVALVGVQLARPAAGTSGLSAAFADSGIGVQQRGEHRAVVGVRAGDQGVQRQPVAVAQDVVLACRPCRDRSGSARSAHRGAWRARSRCPPRPGDQSSRSCWASRSSTARCSRCHTPACCHSRSRRQQVTPDPQPNSWGRSFQLIPVRSTNMIPASAARSGTRGRPLRPRFPLACGGSSGSTSAHSSSLTNRSTQDRFTIDGDHRERAMLHTGPTRRLLKRPLGLRTATSRHAAARSSAATGDQRLGWPTIGVRDARSNRSPASRGTISPSPPRCVTTPTAVNMSPAACAMPGTSSPSPAATVAVAWSSAASASPTAPSRSARPTSVRSPGAGAIGGRGGGRHPPLQQLR